MSYGFFWNVFREGYLSFNQYNDQVKSFDNGYSELADILNDLAAHCFQDKINYATLLLRCY